MVDKVKHVLGLSGGKDSSALAIYMSQAHPELDIEYFFTDTGEELDEVYEYLAMLEGFLGKKIRYLDPGRDFKFYLAQYNQFLPSAQTRWCTKDLKIKPFEKWVKSEFTEQGYTVYSYVAIRADEDFRQGLNSKNGNLITKLPFKDDGIDKAGVFEILENSGLGLPSYYDWRSRSGCTFCFFQQKIEWVGLKERYPEAFERAKQMEKTSLDHGSPFSWSEGETLLELEKPERIAQIRADHEKRVERAKAKRKVDPLRPEQGAVDLDEIYGQQKVCLACHK
ncbi:phosphoadenosine phosphosulfate reductase family protein [Aliiroseovarius sp. F47248L]|uniref:phosphoadenosine phosphosulfate reductase domain-containing protein n=1 Tax=Aliiroseovarius sp. F47248L TaxID=2926420 RepID=UPI001FF1AB1C|nr:phosphoadenosine phosphosulfate reductase family protein [Aliiroseovarius sp. F47248L]MCK0138005.1 phosphoadenosine phosphosulfate reductase family protein [Aliiroseovarius sp. F47248L]